MADSGSRPSKTRQKSSKRRSGGNVCSYCKNESFDSVNEFIEHKKTPKHQKRRVFFMALKSFFKPDGTLMTDKEKGLVLAYALIDSMAKLKDILAEIGVKLDGVTPTPTPQTDEDKLLHVVNVAMDLLKFMKKKLSVAGLPIE